MMHVAAAYCDRCDLGFEARTRYPDIAPWPEMLRHGVSCGLCGQTLTLRERWEPYSLASSPT